MFNVLTQDIEHKHSNLLASIWSSGVLRTKWGPVDQVLVGGAYNHHMHFDLHLAMKRGIC